MNSLRRVAKEALPGWLMLTGAMLALFWWLGLPSEIGWPETFRRFAIGSVVGYVGLVIFLVNHKLT